MKSANNKKIHKITIVLFLLYINLMGILTVCLKDRTYSELENRYLSKKPSFLLSDFINGKYQKNLEKYISDQFPLRDMFISLKSASELILNKKENNGVYLGKDNTLIQKFENYDEEQINRNIAHIKEFAKDYNKIIMLVPTALSVYDYNVPKFSKNINEKAVIDNIKNSFDNSIKWVDVGKRLYENKEKYLYYRTDHHWTTLGAYYGYVALCETIGLEPVKEEKFKKTIVSENFYGSLFSKGNFRWIKGDTIQRWDYQNMPKVTVNYNNGQYISDSMYETSYLNKKDKYGYFLNNNNALVKIQSDISNNKKILIIKDSYSHSLIPFLTKYFSEIHIIDLRLYNSSVKEYLSENNIEDILFLYNIKNFTETRDLIKLKR